MEPYQPAVETRIACAQDILTRSVTFLEGVIKHQIEGYRGDERMALEAVLNRYKGVMPPDVTDSVMLDGFKLVNEYMFEEMIRNAVLKYPETYQETMRRILLYKEPKPPEKVHERGTPRLEYRY